MKDRSSHYRIKPYISIIVHSPNQVELRSGVWNSVSYTLNENTESNKLAGMILSLDGSKTPTEIAKEQDLNISTVENLIDHLKKIDAVETGPTNLLDYYLAQLPFPEINLQSSQPVIFVGDTQINQAIIQQIRPYFLHDKQLEILSSAHPLYQILYSKSGDEFESELSLEKKCEQIRGIENALVVFTSSVIRPNLLLKFNRLAYRAGINWMHGCLDGPMIYIGPMFFAKAGPCYACFESRMAMNLVEHDSYVGYKKAIALNHVKINEFVTPIFINLLASHLGMEIINYVLTKNTYLYNRVLSLYLPTKEIGHNELLRMPDCPVCGSVRERDGQSTYFDIQRLAERI
jgi:thiazole/oxazole-forming peptide maturase SagC family component